MQKKKKKKKKNKKKKKSKPQRSARKKISEITQARNTSLRSKLHMLKRKKDIHACREWTV